MFLRVFTIHGLDPCVMNFCYNISEMILYRLALHKIYVSLHAFVLQPIPCAYHVTFTTQVNSTTIYARSALEVKLSLRSLSYLFI